MIGSGKFLGLGSMTTCLQTSVVDGASCSRVADIWDLDFWI
jgi:hypothetical protein